MTSIGIGIAIGGLAAFALRWLYYWHAMKVLNRKTINVRDFGALGDGSTDDTAAFTAATHAAQQEGKFLHIPPGDYRVGGRVRKYR